MSSHAGSSAAGAAAASAGESTAWLVKQSTVGSANITLPPMPPLQGIGFALPNPPTTAAEAIDIIKQLRGPNGLPTGDSYNSINNGLTQNRLVHAIFKLILQCLDAWASNPANKPTSTYTVGGKEIRKHQLTPLAICFQKPTARDANFTAWKEGLTSDVQMSANVRDVMANEKLATGTITECTMAHRVNSANLYLVTTKNHPSFGQSFHAHGYNRLDPDAARAYVADPEARQQHEDRGGEDHEVAVLITEGSSKVYIYDPAFEREDWPKPGRLGDALMLGRVRHLLDMLKKGSSARDKSLKNATMVIGGGGNEESFCRAMCISWIVDVVAVNWMGLEGPGRAAEEPLYFGEGCDMQTVYW